MLSPARKRMIAAKNSAREALKSADVKMCVDKPFNTVVLPPASPEAPISVYFLTPQTEVASVPAGRDYRVDVSADDKTGPVRAFTNSCISVPSDRAANKPEALVLTHLLDPTPTEIHVFTMLAAGLPLYVSTTQNKRLWVVEASGGQARIRLLPTDGRK